MSYYIFKDDSSEIEDKLVEKGICYYQGETLGDAIANKIVDECNIDWNDTNITRDGEKWQNQIWIGKGFNILIESTKTKLEEQFDTEKEHQKGYKDVSDLQYELLQHQPDEYVILSGDKEGKSYRRLWLTTNRFYSESEVDALSRQEDINDGYDDKPYNKRYITLY